MAELPAILSEEYETQFFGFPPSTFFEEVKAIINDRLCEGLDLLEQKLKDIPENVLPKEEVKHGIETLYQHTESNFSKTMKKLESYILGNLMKIPPHILLPSDMEQAEQVSKSDIVLLQTELDNLHMQIKNERYMQAKYKEELEDIHDVLSQQQKLMDDVLSTLNISQMHDQKEKLKFLQANAAETKIASSKLQEAMKDVSLENFQHPAKLMSEHTLERKN